MQKLHSRGSQAVKAALHRCANSPGSFPFQQPQRPRQPRIITISHLAPKQAKISRTLFSLIKASGLRHAYVCLTLIAQISTLRPLLLHFQQLRFAVCVPDGSSEASGIEAQVWLNTYLFSPPEASGQGQLPADRSLVKSSRCDGYVQQ